MNLLQWSSDCRAKDGCGRKRTFHAKYLLYDMRHKYFSVHATQDNKRIRHKEFMTSAIIILTYVRNGIWIQNQAITSWIDGTIEVECHELDHCTYTMRTMALLFIYPSTRYLLFFCTFFIRTDVEEAQLYEISCSISSFLIGSHRLKFEMMFNPYKMKNYQTEFLSRGSFTSQMWLFFFFYLVENQSSDGQSLFLFPISTQSTACVIRFSLPKCV